MTILEKIILAALISSASVMASFISPELILIKKFFALANSQPSQIMTLYLAGYLAGQIVWTYVSNKIGRIASIKYGMSTSALGAIFFIGAMKTELFNLFLAGRVLTAFGLASGLVGGFTIIKENLHGYERKQYLSIIAIVFTASIYFSILLSGFLAKYTSLTFIMLSIFFYNAAMFFICFFIKINTVPHRSVERTPYQNLFKFEPKVIFFSLVLSITTIISYSYALYAPIITNELYSLSPANFGIFSLINMIFILLGGMFYLKLVKGMSECVIISSGLFIIITACLGFLLIIAFDIKPSIFWFLVLCALLNIANGLIYPAATYKALEHGSCAATSSAMMNVIKLIMPIVALYASSFFYAKELTLFILVILLFALFYFFLLWVTNSLGLDCNKLTQ